MLVHMPRFRDQRVVVIGREGGAAFSPLSLAPLAWYDPSDLATLFQTDDTSTPVTADGQTVGRMLDKSGNGHHLTQSTAASRPLYKTSGGLHWLLSDGVDDFLDGTLSIAGVNLYCAAAFRPITELSFGRLVSIAGNANDDFNDAATAAVFLQTSGSPEAWGGFHNGDVKGAIEVDLDTDYVAESVWTSGSHAFSLDGGTANTDSSAHNFNTTKIRLFSNLAGAASVANVRLHGAFLKLAAPVAADRALLRTYLAAKQGRAL